MSEHHYSDGRRWSRISHAWILESSWNDREEIAYLKDELARINDALQLARANNQCLQSEVAEVAQAKGGG